MRVQAICAVLDSVFTVNKIAAAPVAEKIQRTITEQTVEIVRIRARMAREILAFAMREKLILGCFGFLFHLFS